MPDFQPVNPNDQLIYQLMPILIGIGPNGELHCYGSCFFAWPHMAVTAKHVVEELFKRDPGLNKGESSSFEYWVLQIKWEGNNHSYVIWTIESVGMSLHSDIAIIWLKGLNDEAAKHKKWGVMPITFDPPPIGSEVIAFGLHNVRFDGSRVNKDGEFEYISVNTDRSKSTGIVKEHYLNGRDKGLYVRRQTNVVSKIF